VSLPDVRRELRDRSYLFALLLAIVLLAINIALVPRFASPAAWADDLKAFAPLALLAMASTPAVLSGGGGLDISVGPLADVISIVLIVVLLPTVLGSPFIAIPLVLLLGAAVGTINGPIVSRLRYPAFVSTLCGFLVLYGVGLKLARASSPRRVAGRTKSQATSARFRGLSCCYLDHCWCGSCSGAPVTYATCWRWDRTTVPRSRRAWMSQQFALSRTPSADCSHRSQE
jgi:ribose transport system permease protein